MSKRGPVSRGAIARTCAVALLVAMVPLAGMPELGEAQESFNAEEFTVKRQGGDQLRPRISGRYVVWQDHRDLATTYDPADANAHIYGRDIESGNDFKVTSQGTSARPAISGNRVVYTDSRRKNDACSGGTCGLDVRGYNIDSGDTFDVVERGGDQDYPAMSGNLVVWQDKRSGNWDIRGRNLDDDNNFDVVIRDGDQINPDISGVMVVWEDYRNSDGPDIYIENVSTGDGERLTSNHDSHFPSVSGDWVAYRTGDPSGDEQRVRLINWRTKETRTVTDRLRIGSGPHIEDNVVIWSDRRNDEDQNVFVYDIASEATYPVNRSDRDQMNPDISGLRVVWDDARGDDPRDIRGARLTVPTTATATPTAPPVSGPPPQQGPCGFQLGFETLRNAIIPQYGSIVGECLENEWHNATNGDALQQTTGGLMVWRKADNWTAFTNGSITWLNGPCGLQTRPNQGPFYAWEGRVGAGCI